MNTNLIFIFWMFFASITSNSDMDWVNAIASSVTNKKLLQSILINSGKAINDLGQIDAWNQNSNTKYVVLSITNVPIRIGMCLPKQCNHDNMIIIRAAVNNLALKLGISGVNAQTNIPSEEKSSVAIGNTLGFVFYLALLITCLLGMIVEYTNLFGSIKICNNT